MKDLPISAENHAYLVAATSSSPSSDEILPFLTRAYLLLEHLITLPANIIPFIISVLKSVMASPLFSVIFGHHKTATGSD